MIKHECKDLFVFKLQNLLQSVFASGIHENPVDQEVYEKKKDMGVKTSFEASPQMCVCVRLYLGAATVEAHGDLSVREQAGQCGLCGCANSPECS